MVKLSLFASATESRVDSENGILRGVRVITKGEAKGHSFLGEPMIVDDQTISEVVEAASSFSDGVPVKLAHGTDIEELIGSIRAIHADGDCARGDLYLLKSHESYATVIEMAETMPSNFGISISFMNAPEPVKGNDMEPDGDEDDNDRDLRNLVGDDIVAYAARVCELYSADLVANPATGNGLFSQPMSEATATPEVPTEAEEVKVEEVAPATESAPVEGVVEEVKEELNAVTESEKAPDVTEQPVVSEVPEKEEEVKVEEIKEENPLITGEPAPVVEEKPEVVENPLKTEEALSRLKAIETEFSSNRTELSAIRSELSAARAEISIKDAQLTELNLLHRSVLSVMGLAPSIEIPEIIEEAPAKSIIEQYEAMPAGPARLSFFQANRREIERSIAEKLK